jgi:hypothetical protein
VKIFQLSGTVAILIYAIVVGLFAINLISWSYVQWFWFKCGLFVFTLLGTSLGLVDRRRRIVIVGINLFVLLLLFVDVIFHALNV